jgi:hypothetical protein
MQTRACEEIEAKEQRKGLALQQQQQQEEAVKHYRMTMHIAI